MLSFQKIGTSTIQSRATGGVAGGTYLFALPGSPGACRDGWDEILRWQLDSRHRPCNLVELMPRLRSISRPARSQNRVPDAPVFRAPNQLPSPALSRHAGEGLSPPMPERRSAPPSGTGAGVRHAAAEPPLDAARP